MEGRRESMITRKPVPSATIQHVSTGYHVVDPVEMDTRINGPDTSAFDVRTRGSMLRTLFWDSVLVLPGLAFLVYGILVAANAGTDVNQRPVPALMTASGYGPTIFPIAFAAVAANVLKSYAAWKLERGISLLHLEYLLSSRTVFSAFTAPFSLKVVNLMVPLLMGLWALSPLGGQAALRVMTVVPSTASEPHEFQVLEFMSDLPHRGTLSSAGVEVLPPAAGAFSAALSSPMTIKKAPRDVFGNVKIPMVEVYQASDRIQADSDGWYVVDGLPDDDGVRYSSITGLPLTSRDEFSQRANYSFTVDTSYLYTACRVSHTTAPMLGEWMDIRNKTIRSGLTFYNEKTLVMTYGNHTVFSDTPLETLFISWTSEAITNATCNFTMSYVQANLACHGAECEVVRVRPVTRAANVTVQTVLDGVGPEGNRYMGIPCGPAFFTSFVQASLTYWESLWTTDQYSTPIEYYFTNPASPYSAAPAEGSTWRGADIYPIGEVLFSRRFTQLINTFWIASIMPFETGGDLIFNATIGNGATRDRATWGPRVATIQGTVTPDVLVMRPDTAWLVILLASAAVMLAAAVAAAVLGAMREGPDVLDRATSFLAYEQRAGGLVRADTVDAAAWKRQQVRLGREPRVVSTEDGGGWMKG